MIPSAITSAPREGACYLHETLDSVVKAGFRPIVSSEPQTLLASDGLIGEMQSFRQRWNRERLGAWPHYQSTLRWLLTAYPQATYLAMFQDDILLAEGLHDWFCDQLGLDGIVSLYTASPVSIGRDDGWSKLKPFELPRNVYGACAMIFPRSVAERLAETEIGRGHTTRVDYWIGLWAKQNGVNVWLHNPSLCQHIGEETTMHRGKNQRNPGLIDARKAATWVKSVSELD